MFKKYKKSAKETYGLATVLLKDSLTCFPEMSTAIIISVCYKKTKVWQIFCKQESRGLIPLDCFCVSLVGPAITTVLLLFSSLG